MNRIDSEVQGINEILELEKKKRIQAEEQTKELLSQLDRINSGEEDISTLVSETGRCNLQIGELFRAKKEAEDKVENLKKKLKSESK